MASSSASNVLRLQNCILKVKPHTILRGLSNEIGSQKVGSSGSGSQPNVPGLSTNCLKVPNQPLGPGAAKDGEYKNPEYYCYHNMSYFEAEIEMSKFRIPQPTNKK